MKLSQYAKLHSVTYRTAWNRYKLGKISNARVDETGHVIIDDSKLGITDKTAVYARVSSSENKPNLISQSKRVQDFCSAKGWVVSVVVGIKKKAKCKNRICQVSSRYCKRNGKGDSEFTKWRNEEDSRRS